MKDILTRIHLLFIKIISIKGAAFIVACIALLTGHLQSWEWLVISGIVIGDRTLEKILKGK